MQHATCVGDSMGRRVYVLPWPEQYGKKGVRAALAGLLRLNPTGWDICNSGTTSVGDTSKHTVLHYYKHGGLPMNPRQCLR